MTLPRSRWVQALILVTTCGVMAAFPIVNHFNNSPHNWERRWFNSEVSGRPPELDGVSGGGNKDYPLWYATGCAFANGEEYYPPKKGVVFPFMYPPFAAFLLGLIAPFGPDVTLLVLVLLNVISVAVVVELSVRLAAGTGDVSLWVRLIPGCVCLFFMYDLFLLGQPNLGLLCLLLGGLMLVRSRYEILGGALLAAATAIKAFPAVVIVYLIWRWHWKAAISMVMFTAIFLVPVPATVRGWDRSVMEVQRWADGMIFKADDSGFGQRPEQSLGWKNQSLFGVGHRYLRPVNYESDYFDWPQKFLYVNFVSLDHKQALLGIVLAGGLLGLGFVSVMPRRKNRTLATDALEFGILTMLVTVCTPYAYSYYFAWLIYPLTVCVYRAFYAKSSFDRKLGWATTILVAICFALSAPLNDSHLMMAYGLLFWGAVSAAAGCGWALLREQREPQI